MAVHQRNGLLFVNPELPRLAEAAQGMRQLTYGFHAGDLRLEVVEESPTLVYASVFNGKRQLVLTQLAGTYNLYNIASAIAIGRYFKIDEEKIHQAIGDYLPDNNRSQRHRTAKNDLILDAYNANPSSMEHALQSFANQQHNNKWIILGDMRELGDASEKEHRKILELAAELQLKGVWIGAWFAQLSEEYGVTAFSTTQEAAIHLKEQNWNGALILIKGSRGLQLENLVPQL
jgi:UDP-N-acetylmuramoyl-tripeptide--D-alanyl-D-alanine ligase